MKKATIACAAVAAVTVLVAAQFALAQRSSNHRAGGDFASVMMLGSLERTREVLGLSDQQATEIHSIFENLRQQNAPNRELLRTGMQTIAQRLVTNPNDLAGAQPFLDKQNEIERAMKQNALAATARALRVLTPDQRAKLHDVLGGKLAAAPDHEGD